MGTYPYFHVSQYTASRSGIHARPFAKAQWRESLLTIRIIPSFLRLFPFNLFKHELFPLLTSLAFESFKFDQYDVVLSITSADAKGIISKPDTCHICYCLTPTRYLWNGYWDYLQEPGLGRWNLLVRIILKILAFPLRKFDNITSYRPDHYLAISKTVAHRLATFYKTKAQVIFPPVKTNFFTINKQKKESKYYLIVSRLVPYKKLDYVIKVFNKLQDPLIIIGSGIDENRLKKVAKRNIEFIGGDLTDEKLCWYYQNCKCLIFPGEEDFGITPVEAQACGKPVLALKQGGAQETVIEGKTGVLFDYPDEKSLLQAINKFTKSIFDERTCRKNALRFSEGKFIRLMKKTINQQWKDWKKEK